MTLLEPQQCHAVAGGAGHTPWTLSDLLASLPRLTQPPFRPFPPDA